VSAPRSGRLAVATVALAALLLACGCENEAAKAGTLRAIPIKLGPLGYSPTTSLAVAPPVDRRPEVEHLGDSVHTKLFFTIGLVTHWNRIGNYVTDDEAASRAAVAELHGAMLDTLRAANVARAVVPAGSTDFRLETEIEHLYGTHYAVNQGTVWVFHAGGQRSSMTNVGVLAGARQYASYGNVVLRARLVDLRGPVHGTVWEEHVVGSGEEPPHKNHVVAAQTALREAVADALSTLAVRVGAALDRLQRGPAGPAYTLAGQLPPVFLIERVGRYRNFLERVYVDTASGRVLRHEVVPLADPAYGRPGEWLLSRRSPEGIMLSPESYEAYARALAGRYDLRSVDDAQRYHFFGVRPTSAALPAP
jgi:hypothetical protein